MANYISSTRTNYFHVTNEDKFYELINRCYGEDNIDVWSALDDNNQPVFGFGLYGTFYGAMENKNSDDDESLEVDEAFDNFAKDLQSILASNDACIIYNAGWEKLRYVGGNATIITKTDVATTSLTDTATKLVQKMLDDPEWTTKSDY